MRRDLFSTGSKGFYPVLLSFGKWSDRSFISAWLKYSEGRMSELGIFLAVSWRQAKQQQDWCEYNFSVYFKLDNFLTIHAFTVSRVIDIVARRRQESRKRCRGRVFAAPLPGNRATKSKSPLFRKSVKVQHSLFSSNSLCFTWASSI